MKTKLATMVLTLVVVVALLAPGCSNAKKPANAENETASLEVNPANDPLPDGIYPVMSDNDIVKVEDRELKIVELDVVPVAGDQQTVSEKLRILARPVVPFRDIKGFDYKFENDQCTEIGFNNVDQLKTYTRDHVGSKLAVVIDNRVISNHKIREAIESDQVRITSCSVGGGDHLHKHLEEMKRSPAHQE